ncbi:S9 family peptidase [Novosphingobium olei]|uniref:S9 family peptidase n=1 Tax=Novosphingobium olei TaxID=2728851 RepID=UPI003086723D|nr:S9 family peptidase [Novosphingobium olei]
MRRSGAGLRVALALGAAATGLSGLAGLALAAEAPRPITIDDIMAVKRLSALQCSADGRSALYTVNSVDAKKDKRRDAVWLASLTGGEPLRLTGEDESSSAPAFSPDGRWISFLSKRGDDKLAQLWLLDRRGGEARKLGEVKGDIVDYRWSPDSRTILLTKTDPVPDGPEDDKDRPRPVVVDDVLFKRDGSGFLVAESHSHLHALDVASGKATQLTPSGASDESAAEWSPDGSQIAYFVDHAMDPAAPATQWLYVMPASGGAARLVAKVPGVAGQALVWSADGRTISHLIGTASPKVAQYAQPHLARTDVATGQTQLVPSTDNLFVSQPVAMTGGRIAVIVSEDRRELPAIVDRSGKLQRASDGALGVTAQCGEEAGSAGRAVIASSDTAPAEVYALAGGKMRALTSHNAALAQKIAWAPVRDFSAKASDGNDVHGMVTLPAGYAAGTRYPAVLWIHGGPNGQDAHGTDGYSLMRQWLSAQGYAVLSVNYRGSSGRGDAYAHTLAADWGNKDVLDLHTAVDWAVSSGLADPDRLGVGGWSYGGILTDFLIVRDNRFKAAFSGAGEGNILALFGVDEYVQQYAQEIGAPWERPDLWIKFSEPLLKADRIKTPTLFMGGTADDNVPIAGGQQMYQALRLLGVPTQLVAYPDETHGLVRPSFQRDRLERFAAWYARYLKR